MNWNAGAQVLMSVRDALDIMEHLPKTSPLYWTAKAVVENFLEYERRGYENAS